MWLFDKKGFHRNREGKTKFNGVVVFLEHGNIRYFDAYFWRSVA